MKIIWFLLVCILIPIESGFSNQSQDAPYIAHISIKKEEKLVAISCKNIPFSYDVDTIWNQQLNYKVALKRDLNHYENLSINRIKKDSDGIVLYVQMPLSESIIIANKDAFAVTFLKEDTAILEEQTVLGSIINPLDLRVYARVNSVTFGVSMLLFLIIIGGLVFLEPLYQRFSFKRKYIKKYHNDTESLDPFTYVSIEPGDMVVDNEQTTMLLSSWKRINKFSEEIKANYTHIFIEYQKTNFLKPTSELSQTCFRALFGAVGILIGWIVFSYTQYMGADFYLDLGPSFLDSEGSIYSYIFEKDLWLGICIAAPYGIMVTMSEYLLKLHSDVITPYIIQGVTRVVLIFVGFVLQTFAMLYLFDSGFLSSLVLWICISFFFHGAIHFKQKIGVWMIQSVLLGIIAFLIFQLSTVTYFINMFGMPIIVFYTVLFVGISTILISDPIRKGFVDGLIKPGQKN